MSARIAEAVALPLSSFCKSEEDELGEEDTEEDESLDADDKRERESQGLGDEDHCLNDEGHGLGDEDHGLGYENQRFRYGALRRHELAVGEGRVPSTFELGQSSRCVPKQQEVERVSAFRQPTLSTWVDPEDNRVYTNILAYVPLSALVQTPPSPEWSSGSFPISPLSPVVPSPIASLVATPTTTILRYMFRSLKRKQERTAMTFGALWRPMLALEAWAGRVDTRLANMSQDRYDDHRLIHDMLVHQAAMQRELQEMRGRVTALE
ncbi:hypothetical protein Tco_0411911 [Tanacetum coccineum]